MPEVKLNYMYLLVTDGGSEYRLIKSENVVSDHLEAIAGGEADVLRFLAFSDAAKEMSPHPGRIDRMEVSSEEADEDDNTDTVFEAERISSPGMRSSRTTRSTTSPGQQFAREGQDVGHLEGRLL